MRVSQKIIDCNVYHIFAKKENVLYRIVTDTNKSQEEILELVPITEDDALEYFSHGHISIELLNDEAKKAFFYSR